MRLLYVFRNLAIWGGIERILVDKMNYLVTHYGYEVFMLTANQGNHPVPYPLAEGVCMEDLNIRFHDQYKYKGIRRLYDRLKRFRLFRRRLKEKIGIIRPDIIICVADDYHVSIIQIKGKIPLIVEAHNNYSYYFQGHGVLRRLSFWNQRKYLQKAEALVTLTQQDANDWKSLYKSVRVIPNIVHLNDIGMYSSNKNRRVIFVGRLEGQKRVMDVIEIWQKVFPEFPDWKLDIYGEGDYLQQLEQLTASLNMNIFMHRPTNRIFDCYRESDILVLTSEYEPFGLVIPEAMSCGLPVVSYRSPYGPESIITDGYDGFLVPLGNQEAFAERLCQLMDNVQICHEMGRHAIISSQRYSAEIIMPRWKSLFEELVQVSHG